MLKNTLQGVGRRLRWIGGGGWRAQDFAPRYSGASADAWGYRASPDHAQRARWILEALPKARFRNVLEVGCAQGFLTERLAERADRLVACDFSASAIAEAQRRLASSSHVELMVADIRDGLPEEDFDLVVFSDVLYYLTKGETRRLFAQVARDLGFGGFMLIANEWRNARGLTAPDYGFARLEVDLKWRQLQRVRRPFGEAEFLLGLYRRV